MRTTLAATFCFIILFSLFSFEKAFAEEKRDWRVEVRPGWSKIYRSKGDLQGFSIDMVGAWRFYDTISVKLDSEFTFFNPDNPDKRVDAIDLSAGFNYDIDIGTVFPNIGAGFGVFLLKDPDDGWSTEASWHLSGGLNFRITPLILLGIEFKPHFIVSDFNTNPFYFSLGAKLGFDF